MKNGDLFYLTHISSFSGTCQFGEKKFGPVQGSNKQNTKTEVAKLALSCLQDDPEIKAQIAIKKHRISTPALSSSSSTLTSGSSSSSDNTTVMSPEGKHVIIYLSRVPI